MKNHLSYIGWKKLNFKPSGRSSRFWFLYIVFLRLFRLDPDLWFALIFNFSRDGLAVLIHGWSGGF